MSDCEKRPVVRSCQTCKSFEPYKPEESSWGECQWFSGNKLPVVPAWVKITKTYGAIRGSARWACPAHSENMEHNPGRYWGDERRADELYLDRPIDDDEEEDGDE